MDCKMPGFPVHHQLLELAQTYVHWGGDAIQPSHPLSSPSPLAFNLSQHQGLFQRFSSLHQVAKVLEFQLQHQSFQWVFRCKLCKLYKWSDNIQPRCTPFPTWNQSVVPCPVLAVASWPAHRFLKRQVRWTGIPISWRIFHSLWWSTQSKALA